jgi:hypothetical protein
MSWLFSTTRGAARLVSFTAYKHAYNQHDSHSIYHDGDACNLAQSRGHDGLTTMVIALATMAVLATLRPRWPDHDGLKHFATMALLCNFGATMA